MFFSLADLYSKVINLQWSGQIHFYPSGKMLTPECVEQHIVWLDNNCPVRFGDRVIVVGNPSPETVVTMLWMWQKGAVVVPVKSDMAKEAILTIADNCHARFLMNDATVELLHHDAPADTLFVEKGVRRVCGTDLALLIYTSGSTGTPKGIMLSHNNVVTAMSSIATYLRIDKNEHILGLSPLSFDYGLYQLLFCLANDCHFTLYEEDFHPLKVLTALEKQQITLLPIVPAMGIALVKLIRAFKKKLPHLHKVTNTGGHLGESVIDDFRELVEGIEVFAMYGLTECKRALYLPPEYVEQKRGSVGVPIPGLEAKLFEKVETEEAGAHYVEVDQGKIGELFVRGATVMQGYFGMANAGANIIAGKYRDDNWLATGDLFSQDEDGFFFFKGRCKELIKQAGFCIYPTELEAIIEKNDVVKLAAVIQSSDRTGDEVACLVVELQKQDEESEKYFEQWLKETIDSDYRPRLLKFIEHMPLTPNSKVDKKSLKQSLA